MSSPSPQFVVGLGNPGRPYRRTRHNLGFMVVDRLVDRWSAGPSRNAFDGLFWDARVDGRRVGLLEPMTFMNVSGRSVAAMARFYKAAPSDILVVLDDLALPPGVIRLRADGSAGGHNGLQDVITALGTQEVPRLRLGIGPAPAGMDAADYVLAAMDEDAMASANQAVDQAVAAVEDWLTLGVGEAMNRHN
ncbi:MAG: aminoacyl-tRNA hydrolase [Planctomycetes bacterium]|nr:aminoacyl-tRNA hydrolase [Planctomycetota bacterium]